MRTWSTSMPSGPSWSSSLHRLPGLGLPGLGCPRGTAWKWKGLRRTSDPGAQTLPSHPIKPSPKAVGGQKPAGALRERCQLQVSGLGPGLGVPLLVHYGACPWKLSPQPAQPSVGSRPDSTTDQRPHSQPACSHAQPLTQEAIGGPAPLPYSLGPGGSSLELNARLGSETVTSGSHPTTLPPNTQGGYQ